MPARPGDHDDETIARWHLRRRLLGARIRELRLEKSLTQEALSLESGMSRNQLISVEWGQSSMAIERLFDLADAIGVEVHELLSEPSSMPTRTPNRGGRRRKQPPTANRMG